MSGFWSGFIIVLVAVQLVGAMWLLQSMTKNPKEEGEGDTTGHVWDGDLKEYNNQLPRWWLWLFWITAVFMVVYLVVYPGMGNFDGVFGWGQKRQYEEEVAAAEERYGDIYAAFAGMSLAEMGKDPDAVRLGRNLYLNNCATCHGSDARGARGFPNLTDGDWLYGGQPETIQATIANGRVGVMPALGAALGEEGTEQVTQYVLSLSGNAQDQAAAAEGQAKFMQFCSACHGPTGQGVAALGGPNLTDDIWLHGGSADDIRGIILNGRVNQMPAQSALLSPDRIRTLVAYVLNVSQSE